MLTITQIKQLMLDYGFRPSKRLGQNFIIDRNIVAKIIDIAGLGRDDVVLEIGAGLGNVTTDISGVAKKVIAVEFDKRLFEILKNTLGGFDNTELVCRDILKFDLRPYANKNRLKIIGNIPYYITTPILEYIIDNRNYISEALLMVQREFGERMFAKAGSGSYSSLSCYLSYYTKPEFKCVVKKSSFFPQPEVDSVLVHLRILGKPSVSVNNEQLLFKIIRAAFNQRRKMLSTSLTNKKISGLKKEQIVDILNRTGVAGERRPESVSLEEFARIANEFPG